VVANLLDLAVRIRIGWKPSLPYVVAARHHMEQVRDDATAENELSVGVSPVHAPRVARPFSEDLELLGLGVVPPDRGVHPHPRAVRLRRLHFRIGEDSV